MITFIDDNRGLHGVEQVCNVLPIAPSTYHKHVAARRDPARLSPRVQRDMTLKPEIARVFAENFAVYGVRKVWRQMQREGHDNARCTVERLMRDMGLAGVIRGKPVRTTVSDKAAPCPLDHVNRQFHAPAPNRLWVSDFTFVATWAGFVYVAFVIYVYARYIVGWRVSRSAHASFVLDALEQALHDRRRSDIFTTLGMDRSKASGLKASRHPIRRSAIPACLKLRACAPPRRLSRAVVFSGNVGDPGSLGDDHDPNIQPDSDLIQARFKALAQKWAARQRKAK